MKNTNRSYVKTVFIFILTTAALLLCACGDDLGYIPPVREGEETETIEEQVIFDEGGITVTVLTYRRYPQFSGGNDIRIYWRAENKTKDDITIGTFHPSANGLMVDLRGTLFVEAGRKAQDFLRIDKTLPYRLHEIGVNEIYEVEFCLVIWNSDTIEYLYYTDPISIKTSAYGEQQTYDDSGREVFNEGGIRIVEQAMYTSGDSTSYTSPWEYIAFYVDNQSEHDLQMIIQATLINGQPVNEYNLWEVMAGKQSYEYLSFFSSSRREQFLEQGIDVIEEVEFTLWIYDLHTRWTTKDTFYLTDPIVLEYDHTLIPWIPPDSSDTDD